MDGHFDKFIDDIIKREDAARDKMRDYQNAEDDKPSRRYNRLYREHPGNKIRWGQVK